MQHEARLDSHDVESGANCCPSNWTFKPAFGIVHAKGCSICSSYMMHLIIANDSNSTSFQVAIRDRESLVSKAFLDGAQNGWQLQQEYDVGLDRYRKELDKTLQSLEQHQKLLDAAKQEIAALQDQMLAVQTQLDGSVSRKITSHKRSAAQSDLSSIEHLPLNSSLEAPDDLDPFSPLSSTADKKALSIIPDLATVSEDTMPSFSNTLDQHSLQLSPLPTSKPQTRRPELVALNRVMPTPKPSAQNSVPIQTAPEPISIAEPAPNQLKPMPESSPKPITLMLKPSTQISIPIETAPRPIQITTVMQLQATGE